MLKLYFKFQYFIYTQTTMYYKFGFGASPKAVTERTFSKLTSLFFSFSAENAAVSDYFS